MTGTNHQKLLRNPSGNITDGLIQLYQSGEMKRVESECRELLGQYPDSEILFNLLGASLQGQGKVEDSIQIYDQAIKSKPQFAEAHNNKGNALKEFGRESEALASYKHAVELEPKFFEAHKNLGIALTEQGRPGDAIKSFDKAVELKTGFLEAYVSRAYAKKQLKQFDKALIDHQHIVRLKPDWIDGYLDYGHSLKNLGRLDEAIAIYKKAAVINPADGRIYNSWGESLAAMNDFESALEKYRLATTYSADLAVGYYNQAITLARLARLPEARECCNKALIADPTFADAHRTLSQYKKYEADDPQIPLMEKLVEATSTNDNDRTHLSFALAKACEDLEDYASSFHHLKTANDLIKKRIGYSIDNERKVFEGIKKLFSRQIPSVSASESAVCPVFIVGMPRSGTTLTEQILASHSMVHGAGELTVMGEKLASLLEPKLNDPSMPGISIEEVQGIREGYLKELEALGVSEQVIVDKMPTNFRSIGLIISAFPEAKIVHMNRDPMAVCWSNYKYYFAALMSGSGRALGFSSDLDDLAEYYKLYLDLMAFWRERFPGRIYDLDYESLTLNQEDETRRLLEFCELDWEDNCLDFHETSRVVKTASLSQVRKKIYTGSSEAWKKYEKYLEPLKNKLNRGSG